MFKNLFKRNKEEKTSSSNHYIQPLEGKLLSIADVPDPVFSQKMMGDGIAVDPSNGVLVAPADGQIMNVFPTKHALSMTDNNGREILIHVGLDTVALKGEGFTTFVKDGDKVKQGQKLMEIDFDEIKSKVPSIITPMVFTNLGENEKVVVEGNEIKIG
ncbi:PTS glucose transporter subunit IIA [Cytobacillus oceanisediminis]|uniref:PTS glucose transporter subunit IIA n=2 Tax=Niallia TaxID=2837506 RepID=A0A941GQV3_NIACI|nr:MULTISPECIES: PTS glucose transporter subunit IIA [Bacillaceae]EOR22062.1 PTS system glucose-specific transporter subunit IICBA [Niallia nealsonii AAU1]MBQ6448996.1 PTS glucose transporter subunit IIA [Bacillus sp. (in: firmicutes)]MDU1848092.1 PTS glucose transporter subunit IIA [Niallia nealsonii]MBZ9533004.1 PTS glucose transporter subunit IIA [Cytobacillus oceanisediminis]MCB5239221.1 PTS glucose transporter subunit IIA [Niallia circulans]